MLSLDKELRAGLALAWMKEASDLRISVNADWMYELDVEAWQCGEASGDEPDIVVWTALNHQERLPTIYEPIGEDEGGGWEVFYKLLYIEDCYKKARPALVYHSGAWVASDPEYKLEFTGETPLEAV